MSRDKLKFPAGEFLSDHSKRRAALLAFLFFLRELEDDLLYGQIGSLFVYGTFLAPFMGFNVYFLRCWLGSFDILFRFSLIEI